MAVSQYLSLTQVSQDIENNTSRVRVYWESTQSGESYNANVRTAYFYVYLNGSNTYTTYSVSYSLPKSATRVITSTYITVPHKADGTGSVYVSTWMDTRISAGVVTKSRSLTLDDIPRATTPTLSQSSVTMGDMVTITLNRAASSFTHELSYSFGDLVDQTAGLSASSGIGTAAAFTPPVSLASQFPNATSGVCTITCKTYNGDALIGTKTVSLTLNIPEIIVPTISAVSIAEATSGLAAQFGAYVQSKSTLAVAITAAGASGSTITSYATLIQGVRYTTASFTSLALSQSGSSTVTVTVTDSRGRTATWTTSLTVLAYLAPKINSMRAYRINTSGTADEEGPRIAVSMDYEIAEVGTRNSRIFSIQYKKSDEPDTSFTAFSSGLASWMYTGTQAFTSAPVISTDYAYVIRLSITDYFGSVSKDFEVPTAFVIFDSRSTGRGFSFGKVSEKDGLEVAMDTDFTGSVRIYAPTSTAADGPYLRLLRHNETLAAFLATSDNGDGLNLYLYQAGSQSGLVKITADGAVVSKNPNFGTATLSS